MRPVAKVKLKDFLESSIISLKRHSEIKLELAQIEELESIFASHIYDKDGEAIFNYANKAALELWQMSFEEFTSMPSYQSASKEHREERARLLKEVDKTGFIDNYSGIRISKTGQKFKIEDAKIWNVLDKDGKKLGQAVLFNKWQFID